MRKRKLSSATELQELESALTPDESITEVLGVKICKGELVINKTLDEKGIKVIADALVNPSCEISGLGISHINFDEDEIKLLTNALAHPNCKVTHLSLNGSVDKNFGEKMGLLLPKLKKSSLFNLTVSSSGMCINDFAGGLLQFLDFDIKIFGLGNLSKLINTYLDRKRVFMAYLLKLMQILPISGVENIVFEYLAIDVTNLELPGNQNVSKQAVSLLKDKIRSLVDDSKPCLQPCKKMRLET